MHKRRSGLQQARILHDYVPDRSNSATAACLSLKAGGFVTVIERDQSGWYDCEYNGERGWAPSNYLQLVQQLTATESSSTQVPAPSPAVESIDKSPLSAVLERFAIDEHDQSVTRKVHIRQAVAHLRAVVLANQIDAFQSATASLISEVRGVLESTGCLKRDSIELKRRPELAPERKRILATLSNLVNEARKATAPSASEGQRLEVTERVLELADEASAHVDSFLGLATGGAASTAPTSSDGHLAPTATQSDAAAASARNASILERGRPPNLRVKRSLDEGKPPLAVQDSVSPALTATSTFSDDRSQYDPDTTPTTSHVVSPVSCEPSVPSPVVMRSEYLPQELLAVVSKAYDAVVSTIAALVGHVHSFSRSGHSSSFAQLIDLTREAIEKVRSILVIIEAVAAHEPIKERSRRDLEALVPSRDALYAATTSLVTTARSVTESSEHQSLVDEDNEKKALLQSATNVLKISGDCASSVKLILARQPSSQSRIVYEGSPLLGGETVVFPNPIDEAPPKQDVPVEDLPPHAFSDLMREESTAYAEAAIFSPDSASMARASSAPSSAVAKSVPMSRGESAQTSASDRSNSTYASRSSTVPTTPRSGHSKDSSLATNADSTPTPASAGRPISARMAKQNSLPPVPSVKNILDREYRPEEIAFNGDGHVIGGTLQALVERLTLHDTTIDPMLSKTFFLTFRLFTTPMDVFECLCARFAIRPPSDADEAFAIWQERKARPVQLRVYNTFKTWLELHWQDSTDGVILEPLLAFAEGSLREALPSASTRLVALVRKRFDRVSAPTGRQRALSRATSNERLRSAAASAIPEQPLPAVAAPAPSVLLSKQALAALRSSTGINILDIDPLELARQLTLLEAEIYWRIAPEELLAQAVDRKGIGSDPVNVRAMSSQSTKLTGWVAETILAEHNDVKRRTALVKYFIKVSERCLMLNNYNGLMAILSALNSSTISRLKKTWDGVSAKYKAQLDGLRKVTDHSRNYAEYRARLRTVLPPCLPFVGIFLTDITFCLEGNPPMRRSPLDPDLELINFDRFVKIGRIVADMQRFQQVIYHFAPCYELQNYLERHLNDLKHAGDVQSLYRQSLRVEPRAPSQNAHQPPTPRLTTEFLTSWK